MDEYRHLNQALGRWLANELRDRRLTQRWIAERVPGLSDALMTRTISGTRPMRAYELLAILQAFNYPVPIPQPGQAETPQQRLARLVSTKLDEVQSRALLAYLEEIQADTKR